jgi:hypothetical protein
MKSGLITVVNIRMFKGQYYYIGRPGRGQTSLFGNPFRLGPNEPAGSTIAKHMQYMRDEWTKGGPVKAELLRLAKCVKDGYDLNLGCFCAPKPCHGDNIKKIIETLISKGLV